MAVVVEELIVTLSARMDQYTFALNSMQRDTDARLSAVEARYARFGQNLNNSVSRAALSVNSALASVGAGLGVAELLSYADAWTRVGRSLESTEQVFGIQLRTAKEVAAMAVETRSDIEAITKLYTRAAVSVSRLGMDTEVAADIAVTFSKALKLGSASTAEQKSAMEQFSQALQKGKLDGDEFRSMMENAGVVQQALIDKFKVSGSTLMEFARKGKITTKDLVEALQQVKGKVNEAFDKAPVTLSESFVNLKTKITEYVGEANRADGVTRSLSGAVQTLSNNIDTAAKAAAVVGAALLVAFAPEILAGAVALATALAAPATLLAIGATAAYQFGDAVKVAGTDSATLRDVLTALAQETAGGIGGAFTFATAKLQEFADFLTAAFSNENASQMLGDFTSAVKFALNGVIGAFVAGAQVIGAMMTLILGALPSAAIDALNTVLALVQGAVRNISTALNLLPGVNIEVDTGSLGQIENTFKGSAATAEALWQNAFKAIGKDYIGEMAAAGEQVKSQVLKDAQAIADARVAKTWVDGTTVRKGDGAAPTVYPDKAKDNKYTKELEQIKKKTELTMAEAAAVGESTAEYEKAKAVQMLVTAAREAELKITPQMTAKMQELGQAYGDAMARLKFLQQVQAVREDNLAMQREIDLTGLYGAELYKARIEAQLLADAKKAGVPINDVLLAENAAVAAQAAALKHLKDVIDDVRSTAQSALKGFINDLREGKSGAEALANAVNKIADKLIDMAANQLVEAALGGLFGGTTGGLGGGGLGSIGKLLGFKDGGIYEGGQSKSLNRYATGGTSSKAAIFGEAGPEAAVPLPDGRRIPVDLRLPNINAMASQAANTPPQAPVYVTVAPQFNLSGGVSAQDLAAVKSELVQSLPGAVQNGITQAFDRNQRFRRSGI